MADFIPNQGDLSFLRFKKSGRYYGSFFTGGAQATQSIAAAGSLRAFPFFVPRTAKFDRIAIRVTTAGTGTTPKSRLGIYEDSGSIYPGKLVLDAGEVSVNTNGIKELVIDLALKSGKLYWLAQLGQDTTSLAVGAIPTTDTLATILGWDSSLSGTPPLGYAVNQAYGAFPTNYPAGASDWNLPVPFIALRKT